MAQPSPQAPPAPPPPARRRGSRTVAGIVLAVLLVLAVVGALALAGDFNPKGSTNGGGGTSLAVVDVTGINYLFTSTSGGSGCWNDISSTGDTVDAGQQVPSSISLTWSQPFLGSSTCTVETVAVETTGFSIASSNVPLIVGTGGPSYLNLEIGTPSTAFSGVVTVEATTTE